MKLVLSSMIASFIIGCIAGIIKYRKEQREMTDAFVEMLKQQELLRKKIGQ